MGRPATPARALTRKRSPKAAESDTKTVTDLEDFEAAVSEALGSSDGPHFIVAKIEESGGTTSVAPVEPELTLYRFRDTFVEPRKPGD